MRLSALFTFFSAGAASQAATIPSHSFAASGGRNCSSFIYPISVSATNTKFNLSAPANEEQLTAGSIVQWTSGSTYIQDHTVGPSQVNGTYEIFMKYCEPSNGTTKPILQFTHGLAGDHNYWDVTVGKDSSYSFVDAAIKAGYATLTYDRLGVGKSLSGAPDGINVVQGGVQSEIAVTITETLKNGSLGVGIHPKVIGVGHSFGSLINVAVASTRPKLLDGIILTGFTANATTNRLTVIAFYGGIASTVDSTRFGKLPNEYLLSPSQSTDQFGFFAYPNYTQAAIDKFTATKQTYTLGELLSLSNPFFTPPVNYTNPVLVVTGERDAIFCEGNCYSAPASANGVNLTSQLDTTRFLFPGASPFKAYVVPDTGHGINFHTTAPAAYSQSLEFLTANGL